MRLLLIMVLTFVILTGCSVMLAKEHNAGTSITYDEDGRVNKCNCYNVHAIGLDTKKEKGE